MKLKVYRGDILRGDAWCWDIVEDHARSYWSKESIAGVVSVSAFFPSQQAALTDGLEVLEQLTGA